MTPTFAFQAFRSGLYSSQELFDGFDPDRPKSYADILDTRIYREYVKGGGASTKDYLTAMTRAIHDNAITQLLADVIGKNSVVAIMGGHSAGRDKAPYIDAAHLASKLAARDFMVASGGGPGAMEAIHLGATFAGSSDLDSALTEIAGGPLVMPQNADKLITDDGKVDLRIAEAIGKYLAPAIRIQRQLGRGGGIGVPTWLYGQEPTTPFAQHIAKYFQNSIREDGLLALATHGIIYVEGGPGTMQEIFHDAAQNFYHTFPTGADGTGYFSPMVFFGDFWTTKRKVGDLLSSMFGNPSTPTQPNSIGDEYQKFVKFTSDRDEAVDFITSFQPPSQNKRLEKLQA